MTNNIKWYYFKRIIIIIHRFINNNETKLTIKQPLNHRDNITIMNYN